MQKTCNYFNQCTDTKSTVCVVFKNPCFDPDHVSFVEPTLNDETYIIQSGDKLFLPPHNEFQTRVKNPSFDATQCGSIRVTARYEG